MKMRNWIGMATVLLSAATSMAQDNTLGAEDARLNTAYQQRVAQLRSDPAALTALRQQERDWIKQRDQQCGKDVPCLTQATKAHADYFEDQTAQNDLMAKPGTPVPQELLGRWTVRRYFPIDGVTCWDDRQAKAVVGTVLEYRSDGFSWNGKTMRSLGTTTSTIKAQTFAEDNAGGSGGGAVSFAKLGIVAPAVTQIDIRHPDAMVYNKGSDCCSSVPGETMLKKSPDTLIFSLCGIFYEAVRNTGAK
jgi:hypothetical protein